MALLAKCINGYEEETGRGVGRGFEQTVAKQTKRQICNCYAPNRKPN